MMRARLKSWQETADGRRNFLVVLAGLTSALSRFLTIGVFILSIWLGARYLDPAILSVWVLMVGWASLFAFLDLGLTSALLNRVSELHADLGYSPAFAHEVRRNLAVIGGWSLVVGGALGLALLVPDWSGYFSTDGEVRRQFNQCLTLFVPLFVANTLNMGLQRFFMGLQQTFVVNLTGAVAAIVSVVAVCIVAWHQGDVVWLLFATLGISVLLQLFMLMILAQRVLSRSTASCQALDSQRSSTLSWREYRHDFARLFALGKFFFVLQLGMIAFQGIDSIIVSQTIGLEEVALLGMVQRMFQFVSQPVAIASGPLWPAYADAYVRSDVAFIRVTLRRSFSLALMILLPMALVMIWAGPTLVDVWSHGKISVSLALLLAYASWAVLEAMSGVLAMYLNGCNIVKPQVVVTLLMIVCVIPAKWYGCAVAGLSGMVFAATTVAAILLFVGYGMLYRRDLMRPLDGSEIAEDAKAACAR